MGPTIEREQQMRTDPRGLSLEVLLTAAALWAVAGVLGFGLGVVLPGCANAGAADISLSLAVLAAAALTGRDQLRRGSAQGRHVASALAFGVLGAWLVSVLAGLIPGESVEPSVSAASLAAAGVVTLCLTRIRGLRAWVLGGLGVLGAAAAGSLITGCDAAGTLGAGALGAGAGACWGWAWWQSAQATPEPQASQVASPLVYVVFNPSKHPDARAAEQLLRGALIEAGIPEVVWVETEAHDGGYARARAAVEAGATLVIACGGDGTVRACVRALAGSAAALGIIPAGTGNLLAANLGIPTDLDRAAVCAVSGARRRVDVGVSGEDRFAVMAGMGFDARMVGEAPEEVKARIGWGAYVLAAARNLRGRSPRFDIWLDDDEVLTRRARAVLIGNVGRLTGGIELLPDARADDGLLDVAILHPSGMLGWAELTAHVLARQGERSRGLEVYRCQRVRVLCERAEPVEFDGDAQPPRRELEASVLPAGLVVCVPHAALGERAADAVEAPTAAEIVAQAQPTREDEAVGRTQHSPEPPRPAEDAPG